MTLVFPKWIPGNHRPAGPIAALTGIRMESAGRALDWQKRVQPDFDFVDARRHFDVESVHIDGITSPPAWPQCTGKPAANSPAPDRLTLHRSAESLI